MAYYEPILLLAANPEADDPSPEGYNRLSGDVDKHIQFLQQHGLVYWDIRAVRKRGNRHEQLDSHTIRRGYIYLTRAHPEGPGLRYQVRIRSIQARLSDYPEVEGLPPWRRNYPDHERWRLYWIALTDIVPVCDVHLDQFYKGDGAGYQLNHVKSFAIVWQKQVQSYIHQNRRDRASAIYPHGFYLSWAAPRHCSIGPCVYRDNTGHYCHHISRRS